MSLRLPTLFEVGTTAWHGRTVPTPQVEVGTEGEYDYDSGMRFREIQRTTGQISVLGPRN
jgi:hypothetical protein